MSRPRVAILHQGFVPSYRVRFFELLGAREDVEYVVFHGSAPPGSGHRPAPGPFSFANVEVENRWMKVAGKTVVHQPVVRQVQGGFDGAVLGAELKFASNLALMGLLRAHGKAVVVWGQGAEKREDTGAVGARVAAVAAGVKAKLTSVADAYLVYTEGGAQRLRGSGMPDDRIHVVRNTLDMDRQAALHAAVAGIDPAQVREEVGLRPDSAVLIYLGRVYREKRLEDLVTLVGRLNGGAAQRPVEALVVGDGPAMPELRSQANGGSGVHLLGEEADQERIARLLLVADAMVIPGKVGLAVNHAFAHGVPLLTRASDLHAPEVEYVEPGVNGLIVDGDFDAFVREVATVVDDPARRDTLAAGALATRERLSLERMVDAFDAGVRFALARRGRL